MEWQFREMPTGRNVDVKSESEAVSLVGAVFETNYHMGADWLLFFASRPILVCSGGCMRRSSKRSCPILITKSALADSLLCAALQLAWK